MTSRCPSGTGKGRPLACLCNGSTRAAARYRLELPVAMFVPDAGATVRADIQETCRTGSKESSFAFRRRASPLYRNAIASTAYGLGEKLTLDI